MFDLNGWLELRREWIAAELASLFPEVWPAPLGPALHYPLESGGKRVRPALVIAAWEALGGKAEDRAQVLPAAVALELIHTYSLVHDDLPDMDDDDERRGRPTVHVAYGAATAILVGDALLTEAFAVLARAPISAEARIALVGLYAEAAGADGMVGGQAADIGLGGPHGALDAVLSVHARKTGALLRASVVAGGLVAGATDAQLAALSRVGAGLGLAFQLVDDVFDHDEDQAPNVSQLLGREETMRRARALVAEAEAALRSFPAPAALLAIARYIVDRSY